MKNESEFNIKTNKSLKNNNFNKYLFLFLNRKKEELK